MKATIEFDDALYRELKVQAAVRNKKIKDMVEEGVRMVLEQCNPRMDPAEDSLPIIRKSTQTPMPGLSNRDIEDLLVAEDNKKYGST